MIKKIVSFILIVTLLTSINQSIFNAYAVDTNGTNNPWTIEKATHLARKSLFGATPEKVQELFVAGSAINAVNILFPSINGPDRTTYNSELVTLGTADKNKYYMAKKFLDPYEAKSKLFSIFEDTFSVNIDTSKDITMNDIENTYNMLFDLSLGNYKEMIKKNLYNNGNSGDYSLSKFLDLLNQTNPNNPNENYSRELIQLFMMLEYIPTETELAGNTRNYTETDVNSLAKIIYGFEADSTTHQVTYNTTANTNTQIEFLTGALKTGDSFPFYNSASGTVDVQTMKTSIGGNNGLPDNIIDYIFSKREYAISMFLADKFYRFYIAENPTKAELNQISNIIIANNFEIYPTIKSILASDLMYSDKSMNDIIFKNPIDLSIGTAKKLNIDMSNIYTSTLTNLEWTAYNPGSIFGRDGYDENKLFFKANNATKWVREASLLAEKTPLNTFIGLTGTGVTATGLVDYVTNKLYLGRVLDNTTKDKLVHFLTHDQNGNLVTVNVDDATYQKYYIRSLITFLLIQPEYILQSGYDKATITEGALAPFYTNNSKLIVIKSSGGADWLHYIIPKNEYNEYLIKRGSGALVGTGLLDLGNDYYINAGMSGFKNLYDSGDLKIINRVGTPEHSRGHDTASRKLTSLNNIETDDEGIIGHFLKNENPVKTIAMGSSKPLELRNGKYLNITSDTIYAISDSTNTAFRNYKISVIKDIYNSRIYPGNTNEVFKNSVTLNDVSANSVANGGRAGAGYNMEQNFAFVEGLFDSNISNIVSMGADGGYDTHSNQKDYLTSNLKKVSDSTTAFFNSVKDKQDITILIYSEFGRTLQINSSLGTDHGMGGGMFILTNNSNLKSKFEKNIYGNGSFKDAESNWLGVGVDYRSVYSGIIDSLYGVNISNNLNGTFDINSYIDTEKSDVELLNTHFSASSSNRNKINLTLDVKDPNFHIKEASYVKYEYGTDPNNMYEYSSYYMNRYMNLTDTSIELNISNLTAGSKYFYRITIFDNQYNEKIIEGEFISPILSSNNILQINKPTRLTNYQNRTINGSLNLTSVSSSGILLSNSGTVIYSNDNILKVLAGSGTYINELTSSGAKLWNGTFITPIEINKNDFIPTSSKFNGYTLLDSKITKIIKTGADNLGVGMKLNQKVDIEINGIDTSKNYIVISSEDGNNWEQIISSDVLIGDNKVTFKINHFSYFILIEADVNGNPLPINPIIVDNNEDTIVIPRYTGGGGSIARMIKDVCPYGDYSISYYDKTCGVDPSMIYPGGNPLTIDMYNELRNDLNLDPEYVGDNESSNGIVNSMHKEMEKAYLELKNMEIEKAQIFEELFMKKIEENKNIEDKILNEVENEFNSEKEVLILLREKMSSIYIGGNKLIHIKNSNLNSKFEKIGKIITNKNFSEIKTIELFTILNKIVIYSAINELDGINKTIKDKNMILLKVSIANLVNIFKGNLVKKIQVKNSEILTEKKSETITEKIKRINEAKNILNKETIKEKIKRINEAKKSRQN